MADERYKPIVKQYKRRWINLLLFIMYAVNNAIHFVQYSVMINTVKNYYKIPATYVEWTTGLYTLSYMLFVIPGLYILDKIKMRNTMILVSLLSTIAAWIKVFTVAPDRFLFVFIAQTMFTISFTFTFGVSARLTASWFAVEESSRANALSLFGDQFGGSISFIIPVLLVQRSSDDMSIFETSLKRMHIINASLSTLFFALIVTIFEDKPKCPPSMIQAMKIETKDILFTQTLKKMLKHTSFLMFLFSYAICGGILSTLSTVLSELVEDNFRESHEDGGRMGFLLMTIGMCSSPIFSYILDKTHKFKEVSVTFMAGTCISYAAFTIVLKMHNIIYVYLFSLISGIFLVSSYVNGIQIGIEMLYPISEEKCSAMMVFVMQAAGFIFLPVYSTLLKGYGDLVANGFLCTAACCGSAVAFMTPIKLNRQSAEHSKIKIMAEKIPMQITA